jgi:hypothetical protein
MAIAPRCTRSKQPGARASLSGATFLGREPSNATRTQSKRSRPGSVAHVTLPLGRRETSRPTSRQGRNGEHGALAKEHDRVSTCRPLHASCPPADRDESDMGTGGRRRTRRSRHDVVRRCDRSWRMSRQHDYAPFMFVGVIVQRSPVLSREPGFHPGNRRSIGVHRTPAERLISKMRTLHSTLSRRHLIEGDRLFGHALARSAAASRPAIPASLRRPSVGTLLAIWSHPFTGAMPSTDHGFAAMGDGKGMPRPMTHCT